MFGLVVRFDLVAGAGKAFDALVEETLRQIRDREVGKTVAYACHEVEGAPDSRIFYELYEDRAAFDRHEAGDHVKRFLAGREQYLARPPGRSRTFLPPWTPSRGQPDRAAPHLPLLLPWPFPIDAAAVSPASH